MEGALYTMNSNSHSQHHKNSIPSLKELSKRVLKANVAHLVDVGDVPYDLIKDVLPGCRVEQLREIEELSPHIADDDEEIWEYFFKRDFPIVAEAREKAVTTNILESAQSSSSSHPNKLTSSHSSCATGPPSTSKQAALDSSHEEEADDHLFVSYRDLYYDEQVRREERLASAGSRLKERLSNLAQAKSSRQTILDPRLSLNLRKRRRGQTLPTGRRHWPTSSAREASTPKTLAEKARARAGQLAFAYEPPRPRFTRSASMAVGFIPERAKPLYKEDSLEDVQDVRQHPAKGIFGPRRGRPTIQDCQAANQAFSSTHQANSTPSTEGTSFVERTVVRPAKSSAENPHRRRGPDIQDLSRTKIISPSKAAESKTSAVMVPPAQSPKPIVNIPGITRRPIIRKYSLDTIEQTKRNTAAHTNTQSALPKGFQIKPAPTHSIETDLQTMPTPACSLAGSPPAGSPPPASSPPPSHSPYPQLPMLSQQPRKLPPGPSLFIPRKKPKVS